MKKIKVGFLVDNSEYIRRLNNYVMKNLHERIESYVFSDICKINDFFKEKSNRIDVLIFEKSNKKIEDLEKLLKERQINLVAFENYAEIKEMDKNEIKEKNTPKYVKIVDMFEDVEKIIENIYYDICDEDIQLEGNEFDNSSKKIVGIYSLANSQFQLPFSFFTAEYLSGETISNKKVLLIDMQENSGLKIYLESLGKREGLMGLEDLLVMSESGKISSKRLNNSLSHFENFDIVNPAKDSSVIADLTHDMWKKLMNVLSNELDYEYIIVNFGTRCANFYEILKECRKLFILKEDSFISNNRLEDFYKESRFDENDLVCEIPLIQPKNKMLDIDKIVEAWKWSEFGDLLRKTMVF